MSWPNQQILNDANEKHPNLNFRKISNKEKSSIILMPGPAEIKKYL